MTYVLVGCGRSYSSFLFEQLDAPDSTIFLTTSRKSWIVGIPYLINPLGCLISGVVSDLYGRKTCVQSVFVFFIISWIITGVSQNITTMYIGMFFQGLAGGMSFCISAYISEISTKERRGFLLSIIEPMFACGNLLSNVLMYFFKWNSVSIFYSVLSLIGFFLSAVICESPVWLYTKERQQKSIEVLSYLRSQDRLLLESEIEDMEKSYHNKNYNRTNTIKEILKAWKPLALLSVLYILEQNGGYLVILSYTLMFLKNLRMPYDNSILVIMYSVCGFVASLFTPFFVQKFNRKTVLAFSTVGMSLCMSIIAIYETIFLDRVSKPCIWILPILMYFYVFAYTLGVLPLSFVLGGELFPNEVRGIMNGLYGSIGYLYAFVSSKIFPDYLNRFGIVVVLWTFTLFNLFSFIFSASFVPETKGKSLGEVQEQFKENGVFRKKKKLILIQERGYGSLVHGIA